MADIDIRVDKLEGRVTNLEQQVSAVVAKVDMLVDEMRDRDNQRVNEISEIRQDMKDMQKAFYAKMDNMDTKIENMGHHVRNLVWTSMAAIGAMVVTVIFSILKN